MTIIVNPDLGRSDRFGVDVAHNTLEHTWKKVLCVLAAAGACIGAAGAAGGIQAGLVTLIASTIVGTVFMVRAESDRFIVRDECGDLVGIVRRVERVGGLDNYNGLVVPHYKALQDLDDLLDRLGHAVGELGGEHAKAAMLSGRRLAWAAAVRHRNAARSVPAAPFMELAEHWEDHDRHAAAAAKLAAELLGLVEATEIAAVSAQVRERPDSFEHGELAVIAGAEQVRAELTAYSELDPAQTFTRQLQAATGS